MKVFKFLTRDDKSKRFHESNVFQIARSSTNTPKSDMLQSLMNTDEEVSSLGLKHILFLFVNSISHSWQKN